MTFRTRIAITAAVAVALAFVIAAGGLYVATARTLHDEVDRSLSEIATGLTGVRGRRMLVRAPFGPRPGYLGGPGGFVQFVSRDGDVLGMPGFEEPLPRDKAVLAVAAGKADGHFTTLRVRGEPVRALTIPAMPGVAAQIARPLGEVEASLAALRNRLALGGVVAIALAGALGLIVANRAVQPVQRLTTLAEEVSATGDLTRRIELAQPADGSAGGDELHRLAHTFNAMLGNLEQARLAQQQLVADASHELRTPLTSLRTNIEVLALDAATQPAGDAVSSSGLSSADRKRLLDDLTVQLDEFGRLVSALVELARGAQPAQGVAPVQLDELVEAAVDRARAFAGEEQHIVVTSEPVVVRGEHDRLDRAVANLLDNAVKYGGGAPIAVDVRNALPAAGQRGQRMATVTVRDGGPGIAAEHLPFVFDRFYRAPAARGAPGSGLGLAIVKQVAEAHGGRVHAGTADGGGTAMTLELPVT